MGSLFHILLALASLAAADSGLQPDRFHPLACALLLPVPHILGRITRERGLVGRFRTAALGSLILSHLGPILQVAAVNLFGWHRLIEATFGANPDLFGWPTPAILADLAPLPLFVYLAVDARARVHDSRSQEIGRMRRFQMRMFWAGAAPLVVYVLLASLVGINNNVRVFVEEVALINAAFLCVILFAFSLTLPRILQSTWETAPLEDGLARRVLEAVAERANFRCRKLLLWRTGNLMANAAIVGFTPRSRVVLFSDALLQQLGPRELAAVFGHEIGHARRYHVLVFACWTLGFFIAGDLLLGEAGIESEGMQLAATAGLFGAWYFCFGYLSRRFELDADVESYQLTGDHLALIRALEKVGGIHTNQKNSWRHFSTSTRITFLDALSREPQVGTRLRASLRRWSILGVLLFVVAIGFEGKQLWSRFDRDRLIANLRLGRYSQALECAEQGAVEAELIEVTRLAADVASANEGQLETTQLEQLARQAFAAGRVAAAINWLDLAILRGRDDLRELSDKLRRLSESGTNSAEPNTAETPQSPGEAQVRSQPKALDPELLEWLSTGE